MPYRPIDGLNTGEVQTEGQTHIVHIIGAVLKVITEYNVE
jgi:hypothetical protein